jgi:hypothetical protein
MCARGVVLDVVVSNAMSVVICQHSAVPKMLITCIKCTYSSPLKAGSKPASLLTVPPTMGTMTSEEPVWPPTDMGASMVTWTVKAGVMVGKLDIVEPGFSSVEWSWDKNRRGGKFDRDI